MASYDLILLPEYKSSGMVTSDTRVISRPTVRAMMHWAFYRFKQRLLMRADDASGCRVLVVTEHYTTKTCGECGNMNHHVGPARVFECPTCLTRLPRDWNAARNIFLRTLALSTWARQLPGLSLGSAQQ